jgi:uncharacterized protein YjbI with pentapeptide repeats
MADFTREEIEELLKLDGNPLRFCNLSGANLQGLDLQDVKFTGSDLSGANLSGANLEDARLDFILLTGADLRGTNLMHALLFQAILNGAKYDKNTLLPPDLDPEEAGMVLIEEVD